MRVANNLEEVVKCCEEIEAGIKFVVNDVQTVIKSNYGYIHCGTDFLPEIDTLASKMKPGFGIGVLDDRSGGLTVMKGTSSCEGTIVCRNGMLPSIIYNRVFYVLRDGAFEHNLKDYMIRGRFCWFVTNNSLIYKYASTIECTDPKQILSIFCNFGANRKIDVVPEMRGIIPSDFINAKKLASLYLPNTRATTKETTVNRKTCKKCLVEFASEIKMKAHFKNDNCEPVIKSYENPNESYTLYPTYVLGWNYFSEFDNIKISKIYGARFELAKNFSKVWTINTSPNFYNIQCYTYSLPIRFEQTGHDSYICHHCKCPLYDDCYAKLMSSGYCHGYCVLCIHNSPKIGGSKIIRTSVPVSVHDVIERIPLVKNRNNTAYKNILHMLFRGMRSLGNFLIDDTSRTVLYTKQLDSLLDVVSTLDITPNEIYHVTLTH